MKISALAAVVLVILFMVPTESASAQQSDRCFLPACREQWGPYVDKIVYIIIPEESQQIQALLDDEIDMIDHPINTTFVDDLLDVEDIECCTTSSNAYMEFVFNCAKYPFNITAFRRAFAFALDKEKIADIWSHPEIETARPLDSCIIKDNPFSAEDLLEFNYVDAQVEKAKDILNDAGFIDIDSDGYRECPDGSNLEITLEYFVNNPKNVNTCNATIEVFEQIGINVIMFYNHVGIGWKDTGYGITPTGNWDMAFLRQDFEDLDVDWMGNEFWSEYTDELYLNKPNFRNDSFDSYREALLHSTNYTEVWNAAIEMQKIIAFECPVVVSHEILDVFAYRTDRFENYLNELTIGPVGWYSMCQIHLQDALGGPYGGTFRLSRSEDVESFNVLRSDGFGSGSIFKLIYDSLLKRYPDGTIGPLLATKWSVESHEDDESIPVGHSRVIFETDPTALWTDTVSCTVKDVVFSINYYRELEGHYLNEGLRDLIAAYVLGNKAVFEFSTKSYWHLMDIGFLPIIPAHIFQGVPVEDYMNYDPHPPMEGMSTLGAFNVSDYVTDEFIELTFFPDYYHLDQIEVVLQILRGSTIDHFLEHEVIWYTRGVCLGYTIYIDGEVFKNSTEYIGYVFSISTGIIPINPGEHTAQLIARGYAGEIESDIITFDIPSTLSWWIIGTLMLLFLGLVALVMYWIPSEFESLRQKVTIPIFTGILGCGMFFLFLANAFIIPRSWGWSSNGAYYDAFGIEVIPGFELVYSIAILLLLLATITYPIMVWLLSSQDKELSRNIRWFILTSGFLLPSMFVMGQPHVSYYTSYQLGFTCTGISAPLYLFRTSSFGVLIPNVYMIYSLVWVVYLLYPPISSLVVPSSLSILVSLFFVLYRNRSIRYRTFVLPIIITISFSLYLFGVDLYQLMNMNIATLEIYFPILSYPLGILILGQKIPKSRPLNKIRPHW